MTDRILPIPRLLASGALLAVLVGGTIAGAQPRSRPARPPAKTKPAASADASADEAQAARHAGVAPALQPAPDAGAPAPEPESTPKGAPLSPLNPAANEFSDAAAPSAAIDYDRLLAEISALRARVAAVSDTLFHSRIAIALESTNEHVRVVALSVSLDDGVVWTAPEALRAVEAVVVYDHAIAPGHHAVTVDVERRDDRESTFRSEQRSRFIVDVPTDEKLFVSLRLSDDSNMGEFAANKKGHYDLRVQARAHAQAVGR